MPNVRLKRNKRDFVIMKRGEYYILFCRNWKAIRYLYKELKLVVGGRVVMFRKDDANELSEYLKEQGFTVKLLTNQ